jgi:catechol 2,3-dioxygenase-like lactoylglutathione lyase family enzyme
MPGRLTGIAPYFLVADVRRTAEYFRDRLGFRIVAYFFGEPPSFGMVERDNMHFLLHIAEGEGPSPNWKRNKEALDAYVWVDDVDAIYTEFKAKQAIMPGPPELKPWGMKEIEVRDPDGHIIYFGQDIPSADQPSIDRRPG